MKLKDIKTIIKKASTTTGLSDKVIIEVAETVAQEMGKHILEGICEFKDGDMPLGTEIGIGYDVAVQQVKKRIEEFKGSFALVEIIAFEYLSLEVSRSKIKNQSSPLTVFSICIK